jgi:hypothetical protein
MARKSFTRTKNPSTTIVTTDTTLTITGSAVNRELHVQLEPDGLILSINNIGVMLTDAERQHLLDLLHK